MKYIACYEGEGTLSQLSASVKLVAVRKKKSYCVCFLRQNYIL